MGFELRGGLDLETIEVELMDGSRVYLEPVNGLQVIYGKNGAGKSTIIDALRHLARRRPEPGPQIRLFLRPRHPLFVLPILNIIIDGVKERLEDFQGDNGQEFPLLEYLGGVVSKSHDDHAGYRAVSTFGSAPPGRVLDEIKSVICELSSRFAKIPDESFWSDIDQYLRSEKESSPVVDETRDYDLAFIRGETLDYILAFAAHLLRLELDQFGTRNAPGSIDMDPLNSFLDAIKQGCLSYLNSQLEGNDFGDTEEIALSASENRPTDYSQSTNDFAASYITDGDVTELIIEQRRRILQEVLACDWSETMLEAHLEDDGLKKATLAEMLPHSDRLIDLVCTALRTLLENPMFCLAATPRFGESWHLTLATEMPDSEDLLLNSPLAEIVHAMAQRDATTDDGFQTESSLLGLFLYYYSGFEYTDNEEYYKKGCGLKFCTYELGEVSDGINVDSPVRCIDLEQNIDLNAVATNLLHLAVGDGSVLLDTGEAELVLNGKEHLDAICAEFSLILQSLDLGLEGIRLDISSYAFQWLDGNPSKLEFNIGNDKWVSIESLSGAQQRWVIAALNAVEASTSEDQIILIGDEPDSGVHIKAATAIFSFLASRGIPCVITSHSVGALRQTRAQVLFLDRLDDGRRSLSPASFTGDVNEIANRYGTTPFDLLATKRLLVVGEGSHDVAVIKRLVGLSTQPHLEDSLIIAASRGVTNLASVADSVILPEFTDMHVLVVADNARASELKAIVEQLHASLDQGVQPKRALKNVIIEKFQQHATNEERILIELIERAVHRGVLSRIHIWGFPTKDIIELFPPEAFGLTSPWSDLRTRYESIRKNMQKDFKKWLIEDNSASISVRTIDKAFDSIVEIPDDLLMLLREIEVLSSVSKLER